MRGNKEQEKRRHNYGEIGTRCRSGEERGRPEKNTIGDILSEQGSSSKLVRSPTLKQRDLDRTQRVVKSAAGNPNVFRAVSSRGCGNADDDRMRWRGAYSLASGKKSPKSRSWKRMVGGLDLEGKKKGTKNVTHLMSAPSRRVRPLKGVL